MILPRKKDEPVRASPNLRRTRMRVRVPARFFRKRGALDLTRDASGHRRYSYLYEDTLE